MLAGTRTISVNLGEPGLTSAQLRRKLADGTPDAARVAQAQVITVTIGANDFTFVPSSECPQLDCYAAGLRSLYDNVVAVLQRIGQLRLAKATAVRVTGYWEVWQDGQVGADKGPAYMQVNDALTVAVNRVLAQAASVPTVGYVDLRAAFHKAPAGDTDLLAADGNHPNAEGHRMIAALLKASGIAPLAESKVTGELVAPVGSAAPR